MVVTCDSLNDSHIAVLHEKQEHLVTCDSPNDSHGAVLHEKQEHLVQHPGDTFCAEERSGLHLSTFTWGMTFTARCQACFQQKTLQ